MRSKLLVLLMIVLSCSANAEWTITAEGSEIITYTDTGTISKDGSLVHISVLFDYKQPQMIAGVGRFLSLKQQMEIDCTGARNRISHQNAYEGHLGMGKTIKSEKIFEEWHQTSRGTAIDLVSNVACRENSTSTNWTEIGISGTATVYADLRSTRKQGDIVKMWNLLSFDTQQSVLGKRSFRSMKNQVEYDCKQEQSRVIAIYTYPDKLGNGITIDLDTNPKQWKPRPPDSAGDALWKLACGNH